MEPQAVQAQVTAKWQEVFSKINRGQPGIAGLIEFSQAWDLATDYLRPKDLKDTSKRAYNMEHVKAAFEVVNQCRRLPAMLEVFLENMRKNFHFIAREITEYILKYESTLDPQLIAQLVCRLTEWYEAWAPMKELGFTIQSAYNLAFQTQLYALLPPSFTSGFKALCASTLPLPSVSHSPADPGPTMSPLHSELIVRDRTKLWASFEELGLIERYESLIASVGYERIEAHVLNTCKGKWSEPMLGQLREWMTNKMVPWMILPYARGATSTEEARTMLQGVGGRFDFHMTKTLCDLRTSEVFDIIVEYPDSLGALQDLKECMQRVDQRALLVQSLRTANYKRLLHPGADTKDILFQYVQTIRCLRIIDPPGVLLFKVADPIRRYLRDRPDTIRNIVASLVGEGDDDNEDSLLDESDSVQPLQQPEVDDYYDPNWEPEPIDAGPDFRANKPSDIISTLVSIYDSKDLFVKELQVLLAQRLLAINDGKFEKERRNIEVLKIRFGEAALQVCEVMLKDMTDSRRIDEHVQAQKPSILHPTIISRHFWPNLESSDMAMPERFQELQDEYAKQFSTFKPDKKLRWIPHLGTVDLELHLEDRVVTATVPPLEAAFAGLFSEKSVWTLEELSRRVGPVDRTAALSAILTWIDLGVLEEETENTFRLLEKAEEAVPRVHTARSRLVPVMDEVPSISAIQQQQAEQMKIYWKFIEGMLTNLGALPLDRIQSMLKVAPGYNRTTDQLAVFMEAARKEGLVAERDGIWRLSKP